MDPREQSVPTSIGLLLLRLGAGGFMITHGWGKVQTLLQVVKGHYEGKEVPFPDPIGLGPAFSLALAALAEFFCALLVTVGFATRLASIPPAITMIVAALIVHGADPWTSGPDSPASKEPALLFLSAFLALFFTGPGQFSLDASLKRRRAKVEAAK